MSCGGRGRGGKQNVNGIMTDSIVVDTAVSLGNGTDAPQCRISLSIQYIKEGPVAKVINDTLLRSGILSPDYLSLTQENIGAVQAVDSFIHRFTDDYKQVYGAMYRKDREHASSYNYEYKVKTAAESNRKNILTYTAAVYIYGGGAYGTNQTIAMNFDTRTGKKLRLEDIFVPGYEAGLQDLISEQLCDDHDADNIGELREKSIFAGTDVYISGNFIINSESITFIYCENEIACHDMGEIRVTVPLSDLRKIIRKDYE